MSSIIYECGCKHKLDHDTGKNWNMSLCVKHNSFYSIDKTSDEIRNEISPYHEKNRAKIINRKKINALYDIIADYIDKDENQYIRQYGLELCSYLEKELVK